MMDVGEVNGRVFVACVGVGWDAHVVKRLSEARKGHIRFTSYVRPVLCATFDYGFDPLTVTAADGPSTISRRGPSTTSCCSRASPRSCAPESRSW